MHGDREGQRTGRSQWWIPPVGEEASWWAHTPELTKQEVVLGASLCPPGPHALLLVHREDFSLGDDELRALEEHVGLLGEGAWAHCMLLFTYGDWLGGASVEQCEPRRVCVSGPCSRATGR